jgi:flagellar biosynthesis/type III secretory pathway protein FliH
MALPPNPPAKFTFDTEFFEVVGVGRNTMPVSLSPSATRASETKLQQAYAEGHAAGLIEGQQQGQADLAQLQQHLQNTLMALQQSLAAREAELIRNLLGLMHGSLQTLLKHASQHYPAELLEHHLQALLPLAKTDETLTLRIHPSARGYHEKLGMPQATILGLPLRIVPDSTLGPVDAVLEWQHGGIEARLDDHTAALQNLFQAAEATALPTPQLPDSAPTMPNISITKNFAHELSPARGPEPSQQLATAEQERTARAAALLGDDDLVDALK